jgi:hypothetical protein
MESINLLTTELSAITDALDRVADKIADIKNEPHVKEALIKQYEELKKLKIKIESHIKELEQQKII